MSKRVIVMHNNGDREERETEREREKLEIMRNSDFYSF